MKEYYSKKTMKYVLIVFVAVLAVALPILIVFGGLYAGGYFAIKYGEWSFDGDNNSHTELFDVSMLQKYELDWLELPETEDVRRYYSDSFYVYECAVESDEEITQYANEVLNGFIENNYFVAYCGETSTVYPKYIPSRELSDFKKAEGQLEYGFEYRKIYLKNYTYGNQIETKYISIGKGVGDGGETTLVIKIPQKRTVPYGIITEKV